jgi:hypothetical protein
VNTIDEVAEQERLRRDLGRRLDLPDPVAVGSLNGQKMTLGAADRGVEHGHESRW